jgi:hypothetical protein
MTGQTGRMEIRKMEMQDIDEAARITIDSFDDYNILSKLGYGFLQTMYFPTMINKTDSGALVALQGGKILGYFCYMKNFNAFNKDLWFGKLYNSVYFVLAAILRGRLLPRDFYIILVYSRWIRKQNIENETQLGPIVVAPDVKGKPIGGMVTFSLVRMVLEQLRSEGVRFFWSTLDSRNRSRILNKSLGFKEQASLRIGGVEEILVVKKS